MDNAKVYKEQGTLISLSIYSMHVNKLPKFIDVVKCLEEFKLKEKIGDL